jgi:phage-related minor tail protein
MTILDIVTTHTDDASDSLANVDKSLGKLGATAGKAATVGLGLAAAGVTAVAAAAVGTGIAALNLSTDINNATNNIAAQLGMSQDEAASFEGVMKDIFANNFGESFDDIGSAITTISQNLGEMPDAALQGIAEDAFRLRDAFDLDVNESFCRVYF